MAREGSHPHEELMSLLHPARKDGEIFCNPVPTAVGDLRIIAKVLPLYLTNREQRVPTQAFRFRTDTTAFAQEPRTGLRVTWFGHSSALIEMDGVRVLLDPVWDLRASPATWFGPKRFFAPTMPLAEMPNVDVILITHDHYDHLGEATVRELSRLACASDAMWITSLEVAPILTRFGVPRERIREMNWMDQLSVTAERSGAAASVTAYPARHFSGRSLTNRFKTLWSSFVLESSGHAVYVGADSGWWPGFAEIAARHPPFDLTLLEVGAFNELWRDIHLGPDGAARAFREMGTPGLLMPVHWGLFDLALHAWTQPIARLTELADAEGLRLWSPEPGLPTDVVAGEQVRSDWWR